MNRSETSCNFRFIRIQLTFRLFLFSANNLSGRFDDVCGTPVSQSSRGSNTMETISKAEETEDEAEVAGDETDQDGNKTHITGIATHKPNFLTDRFKTLYNHNRKTL